MTSIDLSEPVSQDVVVEPAVPVSVEAFVLGGIAFVLAWLVLPGILWLLRRPQRPRLRAPPPQRP